MGKIFEILFTTAEKQNQKPLYIVMRPHDNVSMTDHIYDGETVKL